MSPCFAWVPRRAIVGTPRHRIRGLLRLSQWKNTGFRPLKILALDTSTDACSVALSVDALVCERLERGQKHSSRILSMVDEVLAESGLSLTQLDALAFGRGPGSFTGLRIGTGVVQGLGFGADLPVVPVSSLATLAQGQDARCVLAAFDARMSQVYWGAYLRNADGLVELRGREQVLAPCDVPLPGPEHDWLGAGSGWDTHAEALRIRLGRRVRDWLPNCFPHARDVARLARVELDRGAAVTPEQALPVYIRDEVTKKI